MSTEGARGIFKRAQKKAFEKAQKEAAKARAKKRKIKIPTQLELAKLEARANIERARKAAIRQRRDMKLMDIEAPDPRKLKKSKKSKGARKRNK